MFTDPGQERLSVEGTCIIIALAIHYKREKEAEQFIFGTTHSTQLIDVSPSQELLRASVSWKDG